MARLVASFARNLLRRHPHRARQRLLLEHPPPQPGGDIVGSTEQAAGAGDVEERLVQAERLDERGDRTEQLHQPTRDLGVVLMVAGQEHRVGAQATRPHRRHGRVHPVAARLVGRRRDDAARAGSADDHRPAAQLGAAQQLHRRVERVHVDVQDRPRHRAQIRVIDSAAERSPSIA